MLLDKPSSCIGCPLHSAPHGKPTGFSQPCGEGLGGVAIVAEALGEAEEQEGMALVGKSGYALFQELARVGIERDQFTLTNSIFCRPKDNKLVGMSFEKEALLHCAPNLDKALDDARAHATSIGKHFTIVTLGNTAHKRVLNLDYKRDADLLKKDFYAYPFWSDRYSCYVFNAPHPAYLVRGKTQYWPVVRFVVKRALEVAETGLTLDEPRYLLDPEPSMFDLWVEGYVLSLNRVPDNPLSYDIETPYKKSTAEDELAKEEDDDHTIIRIGFSYELDGQIHTTSIRWSAEFMSGIERLFKIAPFVLGWNSDKYDYPRVSRYVQVNGISLDAMVAWHILQSSLDKSLGFVTPFYWPGTTMWKHLADSQPAYYNAKDAEAALRNYIGIKKDLVTNRLWAVYERHWIELSKALKYMSNMGVLVDAQMRNDAETTMTTMIEGIEVKMDEAVPVEARKIKVAKKQPKDLTGWTETSMEYPVSVCDLCGLLKPERWKKHTTLCSGKGGPFLLPQTVWALPLEFKVSKLGLSNYQKALKHQAIMSRKEHKVTYDADAIALLVKKYPKDPLYPRILEHRKVGKLLGTYVGYTLPTGRLHGGMPTGPDGRIHTVYSRNASTLRFTSEEPNLQNLPRPNAKDSSDITNIIRNLVIASPGNILYARDFSGIEAVLTGYFALDPGYIRIAKRDIHTYYTVHALYELEGGARIKSYDLPDLGWPDDRLFPYLEELKGRFKSERNNLFKHLVHAANFMQGAKGAADKIFSETGVQYPIHTVQKVMDVYYALFPKIRKWHNSILEEAAVEGFLRNPFDYVHFFARPKEWRKEFGEWKWKPGSDANRAIAFKPQSTAVGIITEAILRLYFERFEEAGQYLRLQVHDELLSEVPLDKWEQVDRAMVEEMERPIPQLRLPESWGMGEYLNILTEAKADFNTPSRWGSMRGI